MFNSQCFLSRKGPLGAIWVAAYCFKRLKKAQVFETDISFSVDKILQDKFDVLTYRVLAYLLLGVVRIYSRKVDYLLDECNEVIVKINEFVAEERHKVVERETICAPFFSITLPECFELDAFDLEIHDDDYVNNVMPLEKITLKDVAWKTNMGLNSLGKNWHEEFAACSDTFDYNPTGDGHSSHLMDIDAGLRTSDYLADQEMDVEKLSRDKTFDGEELKAKMFDKVDEEPQEVTRSSGGGHQVDDQPKNVAGPQELIEREANKEKDGDKFSEECMNLHGEKVLKGGTGRVDVLQDRQADEQLVDIVGSEELIVREANKEKDSDTFSEECVKLHGEKVLREGTRSANVGQDHQVDKKLMDVAGSEKCIEREANIEVGGGRFSEECMNLLGGKTFKKGIGSAEEENNMHPDVEGVDSVNLETSVEKLMQNEISRIQFVDPPKLVIPSTEENDGAKELKLLEKESPEKGVCSPINFFEPPHLAVPSTRYNGGAEELKLADTKSPHNRVHENIQKGIPPSVTTDATPKFKSVTSAATPEFMLIPTPAPKERPRFSRKRKCLFDEVIVLPNHILKKWLEDSSDLVHKRRKGAHNALTARRISQMSNLSQGLIEPLVPCCLELRSLFLEEKLQIPEFTGPVKPMQKVVTRESLLAGVPLEPKGAGLLVLPVCLESVETVEPPENSVRPESSSRCDSCLEPTEIAPQTPVRHSASMRPFASPEHHNYHNLDGGRSSHLTEDFRKEASHCAHQELEIGLLHEDINLLEHVQDQDSSGVADGWSARTRIVADYLSRVLLGRAKEGEVEKVSLLQLLEGRTKKEIVRLFYEILVLKSKGLINVAQTDAYGDILVWKVEQERKPSC